MKLTVIRERRYVNGRCVYTSVSHAAMVKHSRCLECSEPTLGDEPYMAQDEIWRLATRQSNGKGHLHVACLEKRIGRKLEEADFTVLP